jgi:hypothetical protein
MQVEQVDFQGWENCVRISNGQIALIVTTAVGPRIVHLGFVDGENLFATMPDEQGGTGEPAFKLRGGHRFWLAPEDMELTYEPDNDPVQFALGKEGVHLKQAVGPISGCQKEVTIMMDPEKNHVCLAHCVTNCSGAVRRLAPWALSVMAPGGVAIIPLPRKIPHTENWLHNQLWTVWPYTDFADGRWTFGKDAILFRQDCTKGPGKLGMAHKEGWVAYQLQQDLFVKRFDFDEQAVYPDGGVNFETFSNEQFLELESLGGLVELESGKSVTHKETWELYAKTPAVVDASSVANLPIEA